MGAAVSCLGAWVRCVCAALGGFILGACGGPGQSVRRPNFAPPRHGVFYDPVPMVASTEDDLLPTLSASGDTIAYAGRVNGNLDIYARPLAGGAPVRLTTHSTDDTDPVFSPDGTRLAWISQAEDVKGDVWVMTADGGHKRRLTNRDTADQAPFWHPAGTEVLFTCRAPGSAVRRIDAVALQGGVRRTVVSEGWDGTLSADGQVLFYVNFDAQKRPRVFARRLADGVEVPLTGGTAIEATPRATQSKGQTVVVFARFVDDVNNDGVLDINDAPSLWSQAFDPARFAGAPPPAPRPLTAGEGGEIFASVMQDWLVYTAAGRGDLAIFALPLGGIIAVDAAPSKILEAGRAADEPALRRLALRSLVATSPPQAALAHYELARELAERSKFAEALSELHQAQSLVGETPLAWVCALEQVRLEVLSRLRDRFLVREESDRQFVAAQAKKARALAAEHPSDPAVQARFAVLAAELAYALGSRGAAADALEAVLRLQPLPEEDGARALDRLGEIYAALGDLSAVARVSELTLQRFRQERYYARRAAERWVQAAKDSVDGAPAAALEAIVRSQASLPLVAARAAAALARLQQNQGQEAVALRSWQRIAETFTSERDVLVEALLAIGASAVRAGSQDAALAAYERLLAEFPEVPALRAQARRGLTQLALEEAQKEERAGKRRQARQTYKRLLHSNPELVLALRRSIALSAELGDLDEELRAYAHTAARAPRDKLARYAYGYALTQVANPDLDGAQREMEAVLALEPRFAAAQLTLGWIRQMREVREPGKGWLEQAAESFETARGLVDPKVDTELWAAATLNKGNALFALGKLDDAFSTYLERELSAARFEAPCTEVLFRESFSRVALRLGQLDVALDMAHGARRLSQTLPGQPRGSALAALLAALNLEAERYDDALHFYTEAAQRYGQVKDWGHLVPMLRGRALALRALKRDPEALRTFEQLLDLLAAGHGAAEPTEGWLVTEIPANPRNVTAAVYGFAASQEEGIARATAARIFRSRLDYDTAQRFDAQRLVLVRKQVNTSRQGPRLRLELLYALHESALTAVGAGDLRRAMALWDEALPIAIGEDHWGEAATVIEALLRLWLIHPETQTPSLAETVLRTAAAGMAASIDDAAQQRRFARLTALARAHAALRPIKPSAAGFAGWLGGLDATLTLHVQPALQAAAQADDPALHAHLDHWLGRRTQGVPPAVAATTWQQRHDRALWDHAAGADPNTAWLDQAAAAFASAPPSQAPERPAFLDVMVSRLMQAGDTQKAWNLLEQDRLHSLQPAPEHVSRELWSVPWNALRQSRGDPATHAARLKAAPSLVRALEAAPASLDEVRVALEGDSTLVQAFAPNPNLWHWFIIDGRHIQHVQTPPPGEALPNAVQAAIGAWPATLYVDTGTLLDQPAWRLEAEGAPLGTKVAVAEVLSATYLVAAFDARNLARNAPLVVRPADLPNAVAAELPSRSLLHLPLTGRFSGPAPQIPGRTQVVFDRPGRDAEALDLTFLQGLARNDNLAVVDHVPPSARVARAVAQSLLLAGIPTTWVGDGGGLPIATLLASKATGRAAAPLTAPLPPGLRLVGYRGMNQATQVQFASTDLLRLAKLGAAAFKEGRETQNPATWRAARDVFLRLLDTYDFLSQPDSQAQLLASPDKMQQRIAGAVASLRLTNQATLADIYLNLQESARAVALREKILREQQASGKPAVVLEAMINLGRTLSLGGRSQEAVTRFAACAELAHAQRDFASEATCQSLLAAAKRELYDYLGAQQAFESAIALQAQVPGASLVGSRRQLGFLFESSLNNYDKAQEQFSLALADAQAHHATDMIPRLLIDLARVARTRGDYEKALIWVQQARDLQTAAPAGDRAAAALEAARIFWYRGGYQRARLLEEEALALAVQAGDLFLQIQARSLRGLIALNQGELDEAQVAIGQALDLSRSVGRRSEEAAQLNNLGFVQREAGRLDDAVASFRTALRIDEELGSLEGRAYDLRNLAITYARQTHVSEGLQTVQQALVLSRSIGNRYNELQCLIAQAEMQEAQGDAHGATLYQEAASLARSIAVPEVEWRAMYALGRLARARGDVSQAQSFYDQALDVAENLGRGRQDGSGTSHSRDDLYADAAALAVQVGDLAHAHVIAERGRQRTLHDVLASRALDLPSSTVRDLLDAELQSRETLLAARRAHSRGQGDATALAQAQTRYSQAQAALFAQAPRLARAMTNDAVSLQALQAALPPGTWVLSLLLGSEHTVALLVGHNAVHGQCLPMGSRGLQEQVTALHTQMRAFAPAESGLQALADVLLKPWQASGVLQRAHTLIVLPHGPLVRLPFGALPLDGVPLWQDHTLSLALTAGQLIDSLALPPPEPVQTVTALAPHRDLAFARLEALAVADTAWLGSQASRARLQECTTDALDIAAHAELDSSDPLGSAVLLAPNAATSDSGRLELRQVFGLQKLPPLVTLSACDSAAPTSGGGEWLGLGQAFLVAGARTVVASQNRVSDLATALLMKHFYRLVRHAPRAQALQQAAMTVRATFPHPAHWANFMLLGDPR